MSFKEALDSMHPDPIALQTFPEHPNSGHIVTEAPSVLKLIEMSEPSCMVGIGFYCNKI